MNLLKEDESMRNIDLRGGIPHFMKNKSTTKGGVEKLSANKQRPAARKKL